METEVQSGFLGKNFGEVEYFWVVSGLSFWVCVGSRELFVVVSAGDTVQGNAMHFPGRVWAGSVGCPQTSAVI